MQARDAALAVQWFTKHNFTLEHTDTTEGSQEAHHPSPSPQLLSIESPSGMQLPLRDLASHLSRIASISPNSNSLTSLKLWNNSISAQGATILAPAIAKLSSLLVLSLGCNSIGAEGVKALGHPYMTSGSNSSSDCSGPVLLQRLDLTQNSLGDEGIRALVPFLSKLVSLQSLSLDSNSVSASGVKALGPSLNKLGSSLQELDLRNNDIGALGTEALGPLLAQLTGLKKLHLSSNKTMSAQGRFALWSYLPRLSLLQVCGFQ